MEGKVAVLGCGRMGGIIAAALVSSGQRGPGDVVVTAESPQEARQAASAHGYGWAPTNAEAVAGAAAAVVAVKPPVVAGVLDEIGPHLPPECLVLSVAAGITTAFMASRLPVETPVVRAMPNTPARVGAGITAICAGPSAGESHLRQAESLLGAMGGVMRVPEDLMDAVTALSGSGPAYFALAAEAMIEAGAGLGLSGADARNLVVATMSGTARLLAEMDPAALRGQVTSPGGTTQAALGELERAGFRQALVAAVNAAAARAREMSQGG